MAISRKPLLPVFTFLFPLLIVIISKWRVDKFLKEDLQNQVKFQHKNQLIGTWICKVSKPDLIYIHFLISKPMASTEIVCCCRDLVTTYLMYALLNLV